MYHGEGSGKWKVVADMLWQIRYKMNTVEGRKQLNKEIKTKWLNK